MDLMQFKEHFFLEEKKLFFLLKYVKKIFFLFKLN